MQLRFMPANTIEITPGRTVTWKTGARTLTGLVHKVTGPEWIVAVEQAGITGPAKLRPLSTRQVEAVDGCPVYSARVRLSGRFI